MGCLRCAAAPAVAAGVALGVLDAAFEAVVLLLAVALPAAAGASLPLPFEAAVDDAGGGAFLLEQDAVRGSQG
jgi:hypothetical protein